MQALTNLLHKLNANRFKKLAGTEMKSNESLYQKERSIGTKLKHERAAMRLLLRAKLKDPRQQKQPHMLLHIYHFCILTS